MGSTISTSDWVSRVGGGDGSRDTYSNELGVECVNGVGFLCPGILGGMGHEDQEIVHVGGGAIDAVSVVSVSLDVPCRMTVLEYMGTPSGSGCFRLLSKLGSRLHGSWSNRGA